ncbi:MAG TPA: protein kinase [Polyangia bacterium]|nr:protein kinase [Polyangia bacterium]
MAAVEGDPFIGVTLAGKYRLTELIGEGAMGRVYRADHLALEAQVAVKLLNADVAADPQTARRFQTEARAASRLRHPNTIQILDFGQAESGTLYLVMEFLRGKTLARILEESHDAPLTPSRITDLLGQALSALDEAHAAGVVHRDFKPENIFVEMLRTGKEHVKVLDFGIAKLRGEQEANLTSRGAVCGTPEYMSPEQIRGEELDARSDVYAAGIVLYEMLVGERPFESRGPVIEVLTAHLNKTPEAPHARRPDRRIPRLVEQACLKAMSKQREQRFRSAAEFKGAIEAAVRGSGTHCAKCGAIVSSSARFCAECGAEVKASPAHAATLLKVPIVDDAADTAAGGAVPDFAVPQVTPRSLPKLPLPFVGRDDVLARLDVLEREALVIIGEPGIGKTAVIEAWALRRERHGTRVVIAGPDPSGAESPMYPLRRAIAGLLGLEELSAAEVERAVADHPEDRAGLLELFRVSAAAGLPLDVRRRECIAAVLQTLRRAPASVVFEDVDHYDLPSRGVLAQLIAHPGLCTVLATSQQPEALDVEVEVLRLGPLDSIAFTQLREAGLPSGVAEMAGGVPLRITEWVRAQRDGITEDSVEARLRVLATDPRALVDAAAVAGPDLPLSLVARVAGVSDSAAALASLKQHGWLREGPALIAPRDRIELSSPTVRAHVYEAIDPDRRCLLHRALADALGDRGDPIVVAMHAYQSGDGGSVQLERAGDATRAGFDDDAAARWYRASLDRGRQALATGGGDEGRQIRVALKLGLVQRYRGDIVQAEHVLREALELARARKDRWAEVQARRGLARLASTWQDLEGAREQLVQAVSAALSGADSATVAELYIDLSEVLSKLGDEAAAEHELNEGILLCTGGDGPKAENGPEPLWRMLLQLGELMRRTHRLDDARRYGEDALRQASRLDSAFARGRVHAFLGAIEAEQGKPAVAAEHRRRASDEMRRIGDRRSTAELLLALADPATAPRAEARAWLTEADALANQVGWREGVQRSREALARLA